MILKHTLIAGLILSTLAAPLWAAEKGKSGKAGQQATTSNAQRIEQVSAQAVQAYQAGDFAQAATHFKTVVKLDPNNEKAWLFLGKCLAKSNDDAGARSAFAKVLSLQPTGAAADMAREQLAKLQQTDPVAQSLDSGSTPLDNSQSVQVNSLVIKASAQSMISTAVNTVSPVEVVGKVAFGTNAAGSNFWIDGGRSKQFVLVYYRDLDDDTKTQLERLANLGAIVTAKGVMRSWQNGSSSFDNSQSITLFYSAKNGSDQNQKIALVGSQLGEAVSRKVSSVTGRVEFGNTAAGGNYWIKDGQSKQYTLGYVRDLDQATQDQLSRLADSGDKVTVKGTMQTWKDGTASFDNSQPISIYKTK